MFHSYLKKRFETTVNNTVGNLINWYNYDTNIWSKPYASKNMGNW